MKILKNFSLVLLLCFIFSVAAVSRPEWEKISLYGWFTNGDEDIVNRFVFDNNNIAWIASDYNGLTKYFGNYKWRLVSRISDICLLPFNNDTLLYCVNYNSVFPYFVKFSIHSDTINYSHKDTNYITKALCVSVEKDTIAWVGTNNGLEKYNGNTWTNYDSINSPLPYNNVKKLAIDKNHNKWIVSVSNGQTVPYKVLKYNDTVWTSYDTSNCALKGTIVSCIAVDSSNNIWLGTNYGLGKFDTAWHFLKYPEIPLDSNLSSVVTAIETDRQGNVWVGTYGAVLKFANNTWSRFVNYDYINPAPTAIAKDTNGNLWIASQGQFAVFKEGGVSGRIIVRKDTGAPLYDDSALVYESIFPDDEGSGFLNVFPNPVNKNLQISYEIQKESNIEAILCDINGKKLKDIYKGKQAPGSHNMDITTEGIPQGSYYLILIINGEKKVKKLVKID